MYTVKSMPLATSGSDAEALSSPFKLPCRLPPTVLGLKGSTSLCRRLPPLLALLTLPALPPRRRWRFNGPSAWRSRSAMCGRNCAAGRRCVPVVTELAASSGTRSLLAPQASPESSRKPIMWFTCPLMLKYGTWYRATLSAPPSESLKRKVIILGIIPPSSPVRLCVMSSCSRSWSQPSCTNEPKLWPSNDLPSRWIRRPDSFGQCSFKRASWSRSTTASHIIASSDETALP
mmetsp:Transcript_72748/g.210633  ORF Transcript_72748/g.210633 Transcript_72748/m.210633 type:complete len:232 (+) Transcript_72748:502-1197(+)